MSVNINNNDINKAREIIYKIAGIYLPTSKDSTIKNRLDMLKRKFNILGFDNFFIKSSMGILSRNLLMLLRQIKQISFVRDSILMIC